MLKGGIPRSSAAPDSAALERLLLRATGARAVTLGERVQALWSGYGEVRRATLEGGAASAHVVVKYVVAPPTAAASENAAEVRSHRRKLRSYQVERAFYQDYQARCSESCRVPSPIHISDEGGRMLFILEDLDAAGFDVRRDRASDAELQACLRWLAAFHATFLNVPPESLWKVGSYWHLATRPDELRALRDLSLQRAAPALDERLNRARFRTLVHGDAKLQNFCFKADASQVAAVDFQYVGGGAGVKDVAYFLSSCLAWDRLEREAEGLLDDYFRAFHAALRERERGREREPERERENAHAYAPRAPALDVQALESEWRELYPVACADFYRFLLGWAGEGGARDRYLERVTRAVLQRG